MPDKIFFMILLYNK